MFHPVNEPKKPHYIQADLTPLESKSGGMFFNGDSFDSDLVTGLRLAILGELRRTHNEAMKQQPSPHLALKHSYKTAKQVSG